MNGRVGNDLEAGVTTCNNSVIDYVIVSPELFNVISNFEVLPYDPIFSDIHKPISLQMCIAKAANNDSAFINSMCIGPTNNDLSA